MRNKLLRYDIDNEQCTRYLRSIVILKHLENTCLGIVHVDGDISVDSNDSPSKMTQMIFKI